MSLTIFDLKALKQKREPIVMITAYDTSSAILAEQAGIRALLVGDSLGMVVSGFETTIPVTLDHIVWHTQMVARGARRSLVVADMPFLTYATTGDAIVAARRLLQEGGAKAVKLEGGAAILPQVRLLTSFGVPVMGHLGFTPQSQLTSGIRLHAKQIEEGRQLIADARALEAAGAFALVLELVPSELAAHLAKELSIPVIGIGAGAGCDGQIQVWHDVLGLYDKKVPRHARCFGDIGNNIKEALIGYTDSVAAGTFPTTSESASISREILEQMVDL